jgi:hypothetical protein
MWGLPVGLTLQVLIFFAIGVVNLTMAFFLLFNEK